MKKTVLVLAAAAVVLSSCSIYTCPTYAKKAPVNPTGSKKEARI